MLDQIEQKVLADERLTAQEGAFLFQPDVDLHRLGELADHFRQQKNGDAVYYNLNAHLNPTNICLYRCKLCAYSCDPGDDKAFLMTDEEILARGREAADWGCFRVLRHKRNLGKTEALVTAAAEAETTYPVLFDADLQHATDEIC